MRRLVLGLSAAVLLMTGESARAVICTADDVPAATLLAPYFEVGVSGGNSPNTILTVGNAAGTATLAHVVLWSDLSMHVLDFNVYLTGYDVQNINLEGLILMGSPPRTASVAQDPNDAISPQGALSQDITFPGCDGLLPLSPLPATYRAHVIAALTGKSDPVFNGRCVGQATSDGVMRGYVTVDVVNRCTLRSPGDLGYFGQGGDVQDDNVLFGSVTYVNKTLGKAYAEPMVHVEASATDPETSTPGGYTFYGRYVNWDASDHREPLATEFAARYVKGDGQNAVYGSQYFKQGSSLVVWRDSKFFTNQSTDGFICPSAVGRPAWYPLGQEAVVIFDDQEHPFVPQSSPFSPVVQPFLIPFPAETQKVQVGGSTLPVPFGQGWMYLDLNTNVRAAGLNPPEDPDAAQAWVTTVQDNASPAWRVAYRATQLDSACAANHFFPQ